MFVDHVAQLSGGELALARLISALPDVEPLVVLGEHGPLHEVLLEAGVPVEVLPLGDVRHTRKDDVADMRQLAASGVGFAGHAARLAARLRQVRPDLVHTNSLKSGYYGCVAARLTRTPAVWHLHDRLADDYLPPALARATRIAVATLPDGVIFNSAETRRCALAGGAGRFRLPSAVVANPYEPPPAGRPATRPAGAPFVVGMVGRFSPWKGQEIFVRAFAEAFPAGPQRALLLGTPMFGEQAYETRVRRTAQELGVSDRVEFAGFVEDVHAELLQLDVLVHASLLPEPFGQVVVEGMAAGLPVVASNSGGPRELIEHRKNGVLYPPGDHRSLAAVLRELEDDPGRRAQLALAGAARARDFAPAAIGEKVVAFYREVLDGHVRRGVSRRKQA